MIIDYHPAFAGAEWRTNWDAYTGFPTCVLVAAIDGYGGNYLNTAKVNCTDIARDAPEHMLRALTGVHAGVIFGDRLQEARDVFSSVLRARIARETTAMSHIQEAVDRCYQMLTALEPTP